MGGLGGPGSLFRITCRRCGSSLLEVRRIHGAELTYLREHVRECHPSEPLPADAAVTQTLGYYDVLVVRAPDRAFASESMNKRGAATMHGILSRVPVDRLEVLDTAGFTWHPLLAVWSNRERRKIISYDAVTKHDAAWLKAWIAEDAHEQGTSSIWFEEVPSPEALDAILLALGW